MKLLSPTGLALSTLLLTACVGSRELVDPTVRIDTHNGSELGVSTEWGIVFLGRTARAGEIDVTAWNGDGPTIEPSVIEPIGGGLYTAETEIRLPVVPLTFRPPAPNAKLYVIGRNGGKLWRARSRLVTDPRVQGLLLEIPEQMRDAPDQIGAGVFVTDKTAGGVVVAGARRRLKLVGLASGRLRLTTPDGEREYLTVVGPDDLWRLVAYPRIDVFRRRFPHRADI